MRLAAAWRKVCLAPDWLIAVALIALGVYEIWIKASDSYFPDLPALHTAFLLLVALPLAWRRREPVVVLGVVAAGAIAWGYAMYSLTTEPPIEPFLALIVAIYALGAHTMGRRRLAGAAIVLAVVLADIPRLAAGFNPGDVLPAWLFYVVALLIGRTLGQRQTLADSLKDRATRLEQEREDRAHLAVAQERTRIARELHDVIAHSLSVIVLQAGVQRRTHGRESAREHGESTHEVLGSIERTGREALVELRRLLGILRKDDAATELEPQPTLRELDGLLAEVREAGLPVSLEISGEPSHLPPGLELSAYRIVQEALTNAIRHASADRAEVRISYGQDELALEVSDDGRGTTANGSDGGHGLVGMRERAVLYGGVLHVGAREGGGCVIRARLPIDYPGR